MKTESKNRNNILIANTNQSTFYTQENKNIPFLNQNSNILNKTFNGFNKNQKNSYDQTKFLYNPL